MRFWNIRCAESFDAFANTSAIRKPCHNRTESLEDGWLVGSVGPSGVVVLAGSRMALEGFDDIGIASQMGVYDRVGRYCMMDWRLRPYVG